MIGSDTNHGWMLIAVNENCEFDLSDCVRSLEIKAVFAHEIVRCYHFEPDCLFIITDHSEIVFFQTLRSKDSLNLPVVHMYGASCHRLVSNRVGADVPSLSILPDQDDITGIFPWLPPGIEFNHRRFGLGFAVFWLGET